MKIRKNVISKLTFASSVLAFHIAAVIILTTAGNQAMADPHCKKVIGTLKEFSITAGPLVNGGILKGSLKGDYTFELSNTVDSTTYGVLLFSGVSSFETKKGDLFFTEAGSLDTTSPGRFADLLTITRGTGEYNGATGQLYLFGNFDLSTGTGNSIYTGKVCTP